MKSECSTWRLALLLGAFITAGCGDDVASPGQSDVAGSEPEELGLIELALETVPAAVNCLRVNAKGPYREKSVLLPVVPGPAMAQTLSGFPLGKVVFDAEAYGAECKSVTARTGATWVSEPVEVSVVEGTKAKVNFTLTRNGRVDVTVNFAEEPACSAEGLACKSARECCSSACKDGVCQP